MNINVLLFDDFETLDIFGPVEVFGKVEDYTLFYYSWKGGIVTSAQGTQVITQPLIAARPEGILVIPGGWGTRSLANNPAFISELREAAEKSINCLSVCTGAALLSKTGLLDNRKATSNKISFEWVASTNKNVNWVRQARWVVDGKFYTSSGVSAGIDMALGFVADFFGQEKALEISNKLEYVWNSDKDHDMFAKEIK